MTELKKYADEVLDAYPIGMIRRNHGLEHATLHVLSRRFPHRRLAGHSDAGGFWIVGQVTEADLRTAVDEALGRLRAGEANLAVHPNCGTNLVTAGVLAGLSAGFAMFGAGRRTRDKFERLPLAVVLSTVALIIAQPLGLLLQSQVTTSGAPGGLQVVEIKSTLRGQVPAHRVVTHDAP